MNPQQTLQNFKPVSTFSQGQVNDSQNTYGGSQAATLAANQNLSNYQKTMQNPSDMYQQNLDATNQSIGFDPRQLAAANQQLGVTQNQMANMPQSIAAQGGGYGVTAGQMGNNYQAAAGNLHTALADQGNNVNAMQSTYNNALNQAGQKTQFGVQGQQMNLGALKDVAANAFQQQQTAMQNMQYLESQLQSQGQWNTDQARQYAAAQGQYQLAVAQANAANAAAGQSASQTALNNANLAGLNQSNAQAAQAAALKQAQLAASNNKMNFATIQPQANNGYSSPWQQALGSIPNPFGGSGIFGL